MNKISQIEYLRTKLPKIKDRDTGMVDIKPIEYGIGFFPFSNGLYIEVDGEKEMKFPVGGVMALGQDFGTISYTEERTINGKENYNDPTWRNLLNLLDNAGIGRCDCFFTNAIMGARKNGIKKTGKAPPFYSKYRDGKKFLNECFEFLEKQVEKQKPCLILCMGRCVYEFLSLHIEHPNLKDFKQKYSDMKDLLYIKGVSIGNHKTDLALIVHPSTPNRTNNRTIEEEATMIKEKRLIFKV